MTLRWPCPCYIFCCCHLACFLSYLCLAFTVFIGVCFTGNGGAVNRVLPKQEFPFYSVPSLDYFLTGANNEQSLSSSTGLNSTPVTDVIVASTLQSSMALAQPPKEFACTICGRKFSLKCNLNRHNLVHTGVRNYGCEVCGQRFVLRQHLKKHLTRHAKECSWAPFCLPSRVVLHSRATPLRSSALLCFQAALKISWSTGRLSSFAAVLHSLSGTFWLTAWCATATNSEM